MNSKPSTPPPSGDDEFALLRANPTLEKMPAEARVCWTLDYLPGEHALASSFGIQSAVMLHLVTRYRPDIPVILIDTGYLFAETYHYVDALSERLRLNLEVYRPTLSPAWLEARHGRLWTDGKRGIDRYNALQKVEPMRRALGELGVGSWYSGLRREQAGSRRDLPVLRVQQGRYKIHPIIDWRRRDVHRYLTRHKLPVHPLWEQGYQSVGDRHLSRPLEPGMSEEQTRFLGLTRECGLHN